MTIKKPVKISSQNDIINMQETVRNRLKSAIDAGNNELAKVEIDLLERLLKPVSYTHLDVYKRQGYD